MEIDITKEKNRFSSFLAEEGNTNIIFSGIFGIGKTYFIHKFLDDNTCYTPIYLSPVQYSVASNEDIFELIKFDILFQLMSNGIKFDNIDLSFLESAQWLLYFNVDNFIIKLLQITSKVKLDIDVISPFIDLKKKVEDYRDKVQGSDEQAQVNLFLHQNKEKVGSIYEENLITQLISSCVLSLKEEEKKIILVIDDLDRIDPEHIFRILNILSVHENFYRHTEDSKFGFDKTILICDIENIKKIYSSRYGSNVDFNGYIDKFYSREIFHFNNIELITEELSSFLMHINAHSDLGLNESLHFSYKACKCILSAFFNVNKFNIRSILKFETRNIKNERPITIGRKKYLAYQFPCFVVFDFIKSMFCSLSDMDDAIRKVGKCNFNHEEAFSIISVFVILSEYEDNLFQKGDYEYSRDNLKYSIGVSGRDFGLANFDEREIDKIDTSFILIRAFSNYIRYFNPT